MSHMNRLSEKHLANRELEGSKNRDRERERAKLDYTVQYRHSQYLVAEKKIFNLR